MGKLVLFDFDGTITKSDSLFDFAKFYFGPFSFYIKLLKLTPSLLLTFLKFIPNWKGKEYFLTEFYKGIPIKTFNQYCENYCNARLKDILNPKSVSSIDQYKEEKATVVIVSASPANWIQPWANQYGIQVIATQLAIREGKLTGRIKGKNCHGMEKVIRIKEMFDLADFQEIIAYGDSKGDLEMLDLASTSHYKPFRS